MKTIRLLLVLQVLTQVQAYKRVFTECNLKIFESDVDEWHDLLEGLIYGMYNNPIESAEECAFCDKIGRHSGGLQAAFATLEENRNWVNRKKIDSAGFFDKIKLLLGYYIVFWSVGYNIDEMWNSGLIQTLFQRVIDKLDLKYFEEIENNI
jgi:hypothetical protein